MISRIPGWLNYLLLTAFYTLLFVGIYELLEWMFSIKKAWAIIFVLSAVSAGSYLSKFRQQQGGGWRFW